MLIPIFDKERPGFRLSALCGQCYLSGLNIIVVFCTFIFTFIFHLCYVTPVFHFSDLHYTLDSDAKFPI